MAMKVEIDRIKITLDDGTEIYHTEAGARDLLRQLVSVLENDESTSATPGLFFGTYPYQNF